MLKPLEIAAMFPFLPEGPESVRLFGVSLQDLVESRSFDRARSRGYAKAEAALRGESLADLSAGSHDPELLEEVLSYLYARILVSAVNDPYLTRKFCVSQSKMFEGRLKRAINEERSVSTLATDFSPTVKKILDHLGMRVETNTPDLAGIHFADYLRLASNLDQKDWSLATKDLRHGTVWVSRDEAIRLLEEAYRVALEGELPIAVSEPLYDAISADAERLASVVAKERAQFEGDKGILDEGSFPPCIRALLEMTGSGKNVPHMGRFTLVAFLHTVGYDKDGMIALFSRWPDFNVQKSMYQIQHIIGETSGTEYTPPTCATMKTYGICYNPDQLCVTIRHPLSYYRRMLRIRGVTAKPTEAVAAETEPPTED